MTMDGWTRGPASPFVERLIYFNDGSRVTEVTRAVVYGKSLGRRLRISLKNLLQCFRLSYMLPWHVFMKFK